MLQASGGILEPRLVGINQASTFWGFCAGHDSETFAPLEAQTFRGDAEQCFLLAYRPHVKELYLKECTKASLPIYREADKGKPIWHQIMIQEFAEAFELGIQSAIEDLGSHKQAYDADLLSKDFSHIRAIAIHLDRSPEIMCSGIMQPHFDFLGNQLQDLADLDERLDMLTMSLIANEEHGAAVFAWRNDSDRSCRALIETLLEMKIEAIPYALVRFAFDSFENLYMAPDWWENLSPEAQGSLQQRMMAGLPNTPTSLDGLLDDGLRLVQWKVTEIQSVNVDISV